MIKHFISFLFLSLIFYSCKQQQPPLTKEEVIAVIGKFDDAWENKNMNGVDAVLSPTYTYFTQSGGIFSRDSVVATAGEQGYSLQDMDRSELEITISGNTAIVSTRWKGKGNYRGDPFDEDQRCSIVVIKKDNKVEILAEHCTPIRPKRIFH
jgi:ketosteroid isomerase-like protein